MLKAPTLLLCLLASTLISAKPLVIAHRGASGYLPEHTLESKSMAYAMGADYIEQDVVMTKDNELVVLHDLTLDRVTNVADTFPTRHRADGKYYVIDFTLSELRQLKVTEGRSFKQGKTAANYPTRFPLQNSQFAIHTLAEEIELIQGLNKVFNKDVGIYPEIKSPWFFHNEGKDITLAVLKTLKQYGYKNKADKVFVQSFDPNELLRIKTKLLPELNMDIQLVQLVAETSWNETYTNKNGKLVPYSYDWMFKPNAMSKIATYADGLGPWKSMLVNYDNSSGEVTIKDMVDNAHRAGLAVHPYTFRADPGRITPWTNSFEDMVRFYVNDVKVDGVFTDFPDKAVDAISAGVN
jgi:glycerophosphoryl diester phosphodiesterase